MNLLEYRVNDEEEALAVVSSYLETRGKSLNVEIRDYLSDFMGEYSSELQEGDYYYPLIVMVMQLMETDNGKLIVRLYPGKDDIDTNELGIYYRCGVLSKAIHLLKEQYSTK